MTDYWYPTAFSAWGPEEHSAITRVCNSGRYTMGPEVEAFEKEFAAYHGMKHGIMVNSGSSANLIIIAALFHLENGLKRYRRVYVPALAWSTTYAPLVQYGLEIVLGDCDSSWNMPVPKSALYDIALVVGCSILGNPANAELLQGFAKEWQAFYIEDNCESLGASAASGKKCGTQGLMNSFSFFYSHQISAIEGGMILTDSDECMKLCRMLRAHGWSRDIEKAQSFDQEYDFRVFGYNVRPLEMHAAVGREQLKKIDGFRQHRISNVGLFRRLTEDLPITHQMLNGNPSPFGLPFTFENIETRDRVAKALRAKGIDCRLPTGGSMRLHKYGRPFFTQKTPNADKIHRTGMFLGNAPFDISAQITEAAKVIRDNV